MRLLAAFIRLTRWPNLFFIALTQWLFYNCVVYAIYSQEKINDLQNGYTGWLFYLLMLASVFIAAGGYIINDYFDMQIDAVNKPAKVVVNRLIKRRWAIVWHLVLSAAGILISFYISYKSGKWIICIINVFCVLLLWFYSTIFKKKLLSGNIIIAALTAWVVIVVYFYSGASLLNYGDWKTVNYPFNITQLYKFTILYAGFAFIVSLIREVVKDMEDMHGDALYKCKTMPIEWGIPATKVFVAVWIVVCIAALVIVQLYAWLQGWWVIAVYCVVLVIFPLVIILKDLYRSSIAEDYHRLSNRIKFVMFTGILSMLFFKFFI